MNLHRIDYELHQAALRRRWLHLGTSIVLTALTMGWAAAPYVFWSAWILWGSDSREL